MRKITKEADAKAAAIAQGGGRQGRGNFDPAQFQERMMVRYKEMLEITDESEWKAIQPLVQKVLDARTAAGTRGRGMFGRTGRPGGDNNQPDQNQATASDRLGPEVGALQKAIDSKAQSVEFRGALTRYLEYRKAKQAELEKARADLRKVLTPRQEGIATLVGLL